MIACVLREKPDIVCLSALPPFAASHARTLYQELRAQAPDLKVVVGLWDCTADAVQSARRITGQAESPVSQSLAHAMLQIGVLAGIAPPVSAETTA
jgi:hypothetical protein